MIYQRKCEDKTVNPAGRKFKECDLFEWTCTGVKRIVTIDVNKMRKDGYAWFDNKYLNTELRYTIKLSEDNKRIYWGQVQQGEADITKYCGIKIYV